MLMLTTKLFIVFFCLASASEDEFHEELLIKPTRNGQIYTFFQFTTTWNVSLEDEVACEFDVSDNRAFPHAILSYDMHEGGPVSYNC